MQGPPNFMGDQRLGRFGAEIAEEHAGGVAAVLLKLGDGFAHVGLIFNGGFRLVDAELPLAAGGGDGGAALFAQRDGKTVARNGDQAQFDFGNVL
jgi:hypothetical protein